MKILKLFGIGKSKDEADLKRFEKEISEAAKIFQKKTGKPFIK